MNLFTVGVTKDGRKQITFGNSPEALQILQPIMQGLYALSLGIDTIEAVGTDGSMTRKTTTAKLRGEKRGRIDTPKVTLRLADSIDKQTRRRLVQTEEKKYNKLSRENKALYDIRLDITAAVDEYARSLYGEGAGKMSGHVYRELYSEFFEETNYSPTKKSKLRELGIYQDSYLNTVVKDGIGPEFASFVNRKVRQSEHREK